MLIIIILFVESLLTLNIDTPNLLICEFWQNPYMEKINDSQSVSSLRNRQTGLDPDPSGADSSIVSARTCQLEFDSAANRGIPSPEAIQANSGKCNKLPVRRIRKKWTKEENRIVMECYYRSKPKINAYRQRMHAI